MGPQVSVAPCPFEGIRTYYGYMTCASDFNIAANSGDSGQEFDKKCLLLASVKLLERIKLCCRFCASCARVKLLLESLGVHPPVVIQNVSVPLCYHRSSGMAGIALNALNVAATEHHVGGTGVTDAVKGHPGKAIVGNQFIK